MKAKKIFPLLKQFNGSVLTAKLSERKLLIEHSFAACWRLSFYNFADNRNLVNVVEAQIPLMSKIGIRNLFWRLDLFQNPQATLSGKEVKATIFRSVLRWT